MPPVNRHVQRSERTRTELVAAARALFAAHGYAAVSTEAVVRAAGVTRGALYHQFAGKEELFRAVLEQVEEGLVARIAAIVLEAPGDPLTALHAGLGAALDLALDPEVVRLTLLDAPAVLGWQAWRELGDRYALGLVRAGLAAAVEAGELAPGPVDPLAQLLLAALEEAMLVVARADDPARARAEAGTALARLLDGLRQAHSTP
jgi:AcrR family transcriptional regulator